MRKLIIILLIPYSFYSFNNNETNQESPSISATNYIDPNKMIAEGLLLLKEGDLVVRLNQDPTSRFIKNFNRLDKNYSHAGIVLFENGNPYVYHIVNGEENPGEKLRKDSLTRFCNPRKNTAYGIFRYVMSREEINKLKKLINKWLLNQVQFDTKFDLESDNKMYCSEMIMKALANVTNNRILIETTKLTNEEASLFSAYAHLPFSYTSRLRVVSIDNLYKHSSCYPIKEYKFYTYR